jgi:hypothetical protein
LEVLTFLASQVEGIGQPPDGVRIRSADPVAFEVPDRADAQARPFG